MQPVAPTRGEPAQKAKFIAGGLLILAAVIYLIISSTRASAQFFLTIEEMNAKGAGILGRELRISGAVIGETIEYDPQTLTLSFTIADIPTDNKVIAAQGGLAEVLHQAVLDPNRLRLPVIYQGPKPDLLRHEAQAILTGKLGEDGVFYASELLLKCPTRYEDAIPQQVEE